MRDDPELQEVVGRLAASSVIRLGEPISRAHVTLLLWGVGMMVMAGALKRWATGMPYWVMYIVAGVGFFFAFRFHLQSLHAMRAGRTRATLLAAGRCPCCAYSLHDLGPDPDGCIPCPECGAAWLASSVAAPIARAAPRPVKSGAAAMWHYGFGARPSIADARDRAVRLGDPLLHGLSAERLHELGPRADAARAAVLASTRRAKRRLTLYAVLLMLIYISPIAMIWALGGIGAAPPRVSAWIWLTLLGAPVFGTVAMAYMLWRVWTHRTSSVARAGTRALIGEGLCPACAGDLGPDVTATDLRLCAGCGAAWKPGER